MGLFGTNAMAQVGEELANPKALVEAFLADDLASLPSDQLQEFCTSSEAEALVEAGVFRKPTLMRLGKKDDEKRRVKLAAYQLAQEAKDPLWDKLVKNRVKEKELINAIMKKYGNKAQRAAKTAQKEYIKTAGKVKGTSNFNKMGGADR